MTAKEVSVNSDQSTSWHAYREAERLTDETLIDELSELISSSKKAGERKAAYFVVGAIGGNTNSARAVTTLLERASVETEKYALASLLEGLAKIDKPDHIRLDPIFRLLEEPRWLVRHAAIMALRKTNSPTVEDRVLAHLAGAEDAFDQIYCHVTLGAIGTLRSIPQISLNLKSRKRDVKMSAEAAIKGILTRCGAYDKSGS